jgi:hypothetical protein
MLVKSVVDRYQIANAVMHPTKDRDGMYPLGYYRLFVQAGIPITFENMDASSNQKGGVNIAELVQLTNEISPRFVLDVQHAYEHDESMSYADDLLQSLQSCLVHLHVSGQSEKT